MNEMGKIHSKGNGNLIQNIGIAIGDSLASVTKGGSEIVRALGLSVKDALSGAGDAGSHIIRSLGSASSEVIHTTSGGLKEVLSSITNGILIWIFILAIGLFLLVKFIPMSPFAIAHSLQHKAENKHLLSPPPTPRRQPKQENDYMEHSFHNKEQPHNQSFPTMPLKPINPITSLYPTLAPYSPHPEHRMNFKNDTIDTCAEPNTKKPYITQEKPRKRTYVTKKEEKSIIR